ncbi:hypothetical protein OROGR_014216 [Orobanche gracilis]
MTQVEFSIIRNGMSVLLLKIDSEIHCRDPDIIWGQSRCIPD